MNTPQFEWTKTRLPRRPQPVPPIYQPEVAARAIIWAVDYDRDGLWVGRSTVKAILGNRLIPRRLDNYLAQSGYDSQQTDEPVDPDREHNLYEPVSGDFDAHGPFDDRARNPSYQLQVSMHRRVLALLTGLVVAIVSAVLGRRIVSTDSNSFTEICEHQIMDGGIIVVRLVAGLLRKCEEKTPPVMPGMDPTTGIQTTTIT